ncbi:MAG: TlpA family protein disulfide reductase [Acidobacteriia bacterium]|nr:TlpA family protein disulfide reductase [Terriglobia bacterium]
MLSVPIRHAIRSLVALLFIGSIAINVWLARVVVSMHASRAHAAIIGGQLPPIELRDATGRRVTLGYTFGQPTIIYWFAPRCSWCKLNNANMATIARTVGSSYRLVGIAKSVSGLQDYLAEESHDFPVFTDPTGEARAVIGLGATPQTVVVSGSGTVLKIWRGAYDGSTAREVEAFFNVSLPGLGATATEAETCDQCAVRTEPVAGRIAGVQH